MTDSLLTEVGQRIRAYRIAAGLTQHDLAKAVGLARSSIANLEAGRQDPPITILLRLTHHLGIKPANLLPDNEGIDVYHLVKQLIITDRALRVWIDDLRTFANQPLPSIPPIPPIPPESDGEHRG